MGYNSNDYKSIGSSAGLLPTPVAKPLYNGNIATMATEIPFFGTQPGENSSFDQQFTYDQLNRITSSKKVSGAGYETSYLYDPSGNIMELTRKDASGNALDQLTYHYENKEKGYKYNTNKLRWVDDETETEERGDDLEDQGIDNYDYDDIGNLKKDEQEEIQDIQWTVYGKVQRVTRTPNSNKPDLEFSYDASGNRVSKKVINKNGTVTTTFYIRDASGNTMAVYEKENNGSLPVLAEQHLYGSQRLGILRPTAASLQGGQHFVGLKELELSDHLGNVSVTLSDYKFSGVRSAVNYLAFGMPIRSYHFNEMAYGYNGKRIDQEGVGGGGATYDYGFRIYNPNIAKFLSVDPLSSKFPHYTPYQFAGNKPIFAFDIDGLEEVPYYARLFTLPIGVPIATYIDQKIKATNQRAQALNRVQKIVTREEPSLLDKAGNYFEALIYHGGEASDVEDVSVLMRGKTSQDKAANRVDYAFASAGALIPLISGSVLKAIANGLFGDLLKSSTKTGLNTVGKQILDQLQTNKGYKESFKGGVFEMTEASEDLVVYRVSGGTSGVKGEFFTTVKPNTSAQAEELLNINKYGNTATEVTPYTIKKGTQFAIGGVEGGTGVQIVIPRELQNQGTNQIIQGVTEKLKPH